MNNIKNEEHKYKLFRTVREIFHPTISKKNISDYKIVVNDNIMPLKIFYPKKISNIERVIIYIPGDNNITDCDEMYSVATQRLALELDYLIIGLDYEEKNKLHLNELYDEIYNSFKYIHKELIEIGIEEENIVLMGDSTGASIILSMKENMIKDNLFVAKQVLFYPVLSGEYFGKTKYKSIKENDYDLTLIPKLEKYYKKRLKLKKDYNSSYLFALKNKEYSNYPDTIIITGNVDPLIDESRKFNELVNNSILKEVAFGNHGFLKTCDNDINNEYISFLKENI